MTDRRSVKTKRAIKQAFLALLNNKPISKITISEMSELADIGRNTFYLHYHDIYALYQEVETEMFDEFNRFYDESFPIQDRQDIVRFINKITDYIYHNKALFNMMANSEDTLLTPEKIKHFFKSKILQELRNENNYPNKPTVFEETESLFIASGVFGVIEDWVVRGMKEEPTGMSMRIQHLLMKLEDRADDDCLG